MNRILVSALDRRHRWKFGAERGRGTWRLAICRACRRRQSVWTAKGIAAYMRMIWVAMPRSVYVASFMRRTPSTVIRVRA